MNPAALKTNVGDLRDGGLIIADEGEFTARNLAKAGYDVKPARRRQPRALAVGAHSISPSSRSTRSSRSGSATRKRCAARTCGRSGSRCGCSTATAPPIVDWLKTKFAKKRRACRGQYRRAQRRPRLWRNGRDRRAGAASTHIAAAPAEPGLYRTVTGAESLSLGLVAGAQLAGLPMFFGGYPITPASAILHHSAASRNMASPPSRRRTRLPRSAPRSARATPGNWASPPRRGPASRSRARRSGSRS